jgi:hypothetical protein
MPPTPPTAGTAAPPRGDAPVPSVRPRDPASAALGNASLLGVGYVLLRRWGLAVASWLATIVLIGLLVALGEGWVQVVALSWWAATTAHGWYLAGGRLPRKGSDSAGSTADVGRPSGVRKQRLIALGVTIPVLVAVAGLRVDAWRIERDAAEAHRVDQCRRSLSILDGLWLGHRVVDGPLVGRTEESVEACTLLLRAESQAGNDRLLAARTLKEYQAHPAALWAGAGARRAELVLAQATSELDTAKTGDTAALEAGFDQLSMVLHDHPGRAGAVEEVVDAFLDDLPVEDACDTKAISDWIGERSDSGAALERAAEVVPRIAPAAIVGCGDALMDDKGPEQAREHYRQLLDQYPDHDLVATAEHGVKQATLAIQLANVRDLLGRHGADGKPAYCQKPAPYGGAEPYRRGGGGPYRALLYGKDGHRAKLPSSWLADDATEAVLVICTGPMKHGSVARTCPYESKLAIGGYQNVNFRNRRIPVQVYELRTGRRVADTSVEIGGDSCPTFLRYTYYISDLGPPSNVYVTSSTSDIRAGYRSLVDP